MAVSYTHLLTDPNADGYNFYGGKGFGDYNQIKDPVTGEMVELSWEKFFSSQEYAQKIMRAVYNNTVNTISKGAGVTIENKFENAKFGIGIVQNKKNPFIKEFYKFDNIQDVSQIPTMVFDDIEAKEKDNPFAISSSSKYIGPILSNVNGGKVNVPFMYYVRNDHPGNYMTYDYENAMNEMCIRDSNGLVVKQFKQQLDNHIMIIPLYKWLNILL